MCQPQNPQPNKYDKKPVCVLKIKPEKIWTSLGKQIDSLEAVNEQGERSGTVIQQYSYGVKFAFAASGEVNRFSIVMLITALSTAFVLMGQVGLVMSLVAYNLSGRMAKTYKEAANTTFNWRREYARYVQCVPSAHGYPPTSAYVTRVNHGHTQNRAVYSRRASS